MYYYGSCDIYCRPVTGQYACNRYGGRDCEPGKGLISPINHKHCTK